MSQVQQQGPVVQAEPQANVYTVLLVAAILVLGVTVGLCISHLMSAYGMTFGQIFNPKI